jgi:PhoH-like ATPase
MNIFNKFNIIYCALKTKYRQNNLEKGVLLVTKEIYSGLKEITMSDEEQAKFYQNPIIEGLINNQYVVIKNTEGQIIDKFRYDGEKLCKLKIENIKGFKPKTYKQECCFDLMSNRDIKCKIVSGVPGSGKTKIALQYGFHFVDKGLVKKIFIIRYNVSVGEKLGFLPGTKEVKLAGWLGCIKDNIDDKQNTLEELMQKEIIEVEAVETIKGRDIKNAWIIVDEAEDLTEEQFKVIGERVSSGSYICFIGDYNQTSQEKYKNSSGFKRAFEKLKGRPLFGFMSFDNALEDDVRSEVSKEFAYYY